MIDITKSHNTDPQIKPILIQYPSANIIISQKPPHPITSYYIKSISQNQYNLYIKKKSSHRITMLSLDSLKTLTIYSKQQIQNLDTELKNKLNECYENQQSQIYTNNLIRILKFVYYLAEVPSLLKQLNQIGEIQLLERFQVLFVKAMHWKGYKDVVQKWVAMLMIKIAKYYPKFTIKPQILSTPTTTQPQQSDIQFLSSYLSQISKTKNIAQLTTSIQFLRIFLISQLQNKKRQFFHPAPNPQQLQHWKTINQSLIKICTILQNIKYEQICVSICYWLCSQDVVFVQEAVMKGIVGFLSQSLSGKNVGEWYGRKILSFLKLLLLGWAGNSEYFVTSDLQACIAQFTIKHDNPSILQQARALLACMNNGSDKLSKQKSQYQKYQSQKSPKNLQNAIKSSRVLLLYSEDQVVRKQLNEVDNLQYLYRLVRKEDNVYLLMEVFNVVAYNDYRKGKEELGGEKAKGGKELEGEVGVVERVSQLLTSAKDKNQLLANSKKMLIGLIRMLKQLVQSRQHNQTLLSTIRTQNIIKKLTKYSDCTNFRFQRELLSLIRILSSTSTSTNKPQQAQQNNMLKLLLKHMQQTAKKGGKKLQDQLQQLQLIYEMLHKGQAGNLGVEVIEGIFRKLKTKKTEVEEVQISILDRSEEQRNRQHVLRINYLVISCLDILNKYKNKSKAKDAASTYTIKKQDIDKLVNIGLTTEDTQTLKIDTSYLIDISQTQQLSQEQKQKIGAVYRRYKEQLGEDCQLVWNDKQAMEKEKEKNKEEQVKMKVQSRIKMIEEGIQASIKQELSQEKIKELEEWMLAEQDHKILAKYLEKYTNVKDMQSQTSILLYLKFLYKLSQIQQFKKPIFVSHSTFLKQLLTSSQSSPSSSLIFPLIFKTLTQLFQQNSPTSPEYFNQTLNLSYQHLSKQSLQFTNTCLYTFQYKGTNSRKEQYWKYIYNMPQMIGREAVYVIVYGEAGKDSGRGQQKFWSFFCKEVMRGVEEERKLMMHYLEKGLGRIGKQVWDKFGIISIVNKIVQLLNIRNQQLNTNITQPLLRKLLRLSKPLHNLLSNQNIQLSPLITSLHPTLISHIKSLTKLPLPQSQSQKLQSLHKQYLKTLLKILLAIYYRKQGYSCVRADVKSFEQVCQAVGKGNVKEKGLGDAVMECFRVLMLRDQNGEGSVKEVYQGWKGEFKGMITEKGVEHGEACERIIDAIATKSKIKYKKQYLLYFFPQKSQAIQSLSFTPDQLLKQLKNLLSPPYNYGLNILQRHLIPYQNSQYSNTLVSVFVNSNKLYEQDKENAIKSIEQVQEKIVEYIWGPGCALSAQFYQMIGMNIRGLRVGLKMRGIGVEGTSIVCEKFYQYPEEIALCAQILHLNVNTSKQWHIVNDKKIPQLINTFFKKSPTTHTKHTSNLIGSSSKLKQIQTLYKTQHEHLKNLQLYSTPTTKHIQNLAATLYAISGLVYLNQQNQNILGNQECVKKYVSVIGRYGGQAVIFQKGCNLLSNLVYKNGGIANMYVRVGVELVVVKVATELLYQYAAYKQFLRLVGNLSLSAQAAVSISKTQFLYLWKNILQQGMKNKHQDIIKYCFDIIYNLINHPQLQSKPIAYKIHQLQIPSQIITYLLTNTMSPNPTQSGLQTLQKLFTLQLIRKKSLQHKILTCLQDIAKVQSWNENIMQKWIKVLYALMRDHDTIKGDMMRSQVFGRLAMYVRQAGGAGGGEIKGEVVGVAVAVLELGVKKGDKMYFNVCGIIDLMAQLLKLRQLKSINASAIIDYINALHSQKSLPISSYNKLFSGLITRLQLQFRQQNSKKIIDTISRIRSHIQISTQAAIILLEFSYIFMTQKQTMTSQKYHRRVREYIFLLTYFIADNMELKIIFREDGFVNILESWIKIEKSLDQDNTVGEACMVCLFVLRDQQRVGVSGADVNQMREVAYQGLVNGVKCLLYRRDHSNKPAMLKLRQSPTGLQLVSYKLPDGQIKQKYILPLKSILSLHSFTGTQQDNNLLSQTVFISPKNVFQKNAVAENCMTVLGIVVKEEDGGNGSVSVSEEKKDKESVYVRQIDVQFESKEIKEQIVKWVRVMATIEFKSQGRQM